MGKHRKSDNDYNSKPFDPSLPAKEKAEQFDEQWSQNNGKSRGYVERRKGRHAKDGE